MLGLLLAAACREPPRVPVMIDLSRARYGDVNGTPGPLPVEIRNRQPLLVQSTPGTLDIAVLLPAEAELRIKLDEDVPREAFALAVELNGRWQPLETKRLPFGQWSAPLPRAEGQRARIRLESRRSEPLAWPRVIVTGREQELPPALGADARPPEGTRPSVVVYLVDALRADHLSIYGYRRNTTPRLVELARHGVVFENAYSAGPNTANAIPSLFVSRYPSELGANFEHAATAQQTLAQAFGSSGYPTGAFTVNPLLEAKFGYGRGFDTYRLLALPADDPAKCCPPTAAIHAAALDWVAGTGGMPFFLYVHTLDVHNYAPAAAFLGRFAVDGLREEPAVPARARPPGTTSLGEIFRLNPKNRGVVTPDHYDEAIASVDDEFGRFVDALPDKDHTIIVFTADHGEALGNEDDGSYMHGQSIHEEQVRVPLVVVVPWLTRSVRVQEIVSHLDVAPTLAELLGLQPSIQWQGRSWLRPTRATNPPSAMFEQLTGFFGPGTVLASGVYSVQSWGIRQGTSKLILELDGPQLFDLRADPKETRDIHASDPWLVSYLTNALWNRSPALAAADVLGPEAVLKKVPSPVRQRLRQALEALGYAK